MKRILLVILAVLSAAVLFAACSKEEEYPTWQISSSITASFSDNGKYGFILTVEGSGDMKDFAS